MVLMKERASASIVARSNGKGAAMLGGFGSICAQASDGSVGATAALAAMVRR